MENANNNSDITIPHNIFDKPQKNMNHKNVITKETCG